MILNLTDLTFQIFSYQFSGLTAFLLRVVAAAFIAALFGALSRFLKLRLFPRFLAVAAEHDRKAAVILLQGFETPAPNWMWGGGVTLALCTLPWVGLAAQADKLFVLLFRVFTIGCIALGLWRSSDLCGLLLDKAQQRMELGANQTLSRFLTRVYQALVVVFAIITALNEFGFDASGLVTGVGLVGLTVSLAAQDTASNLFSGLAILLERPFGIGDWILVNGVEGTVEDISFRSTKIRALDNSLYVLPNSTVANATVNNGSSRTKRLYRFTLNVPYNTARPQLEDLMARLEQLLKQNENLYEDTVFVRLTGFSSAGIDLLVSGYVRTADYGEFLKIQNTLNLELIDLMNATGVKFALPSTSVYVEKAPGNE